ncbi:spinster family MFS transporter [Sphingomonas bacterium]|uniref:spinster family MFS transporter n=1 Tax=Sphingomonas bacterium TaxID=1895847 RepID=UPI0015775D3F|nr:MFS transporter [Sphingomonas bacterium]
MSITRRAGARFTLFLLTLVYVVNFVDRQLIGILGQPMKAELGLSDKQLGLLGGLSFALFNALLSLPIARLAERRSRIAIIAWSVGLWSLATAACGLARTVPQLVLGRMGVGIGEAGYAPAAQSLIADLWPSRRRATALAIFSLGVPIGILFGAVAGGWIAELLGWRSAFVMLGLPGVALAILIGLALREPERGAQDAIAESSPPDFRWVVRTLWSNPAFRHMAAGATLASIGGYGITYFSVPLLMRTQQLPLHTAATGFGIVAGLGIGIGIAAGGLIADKLRQKDARAITAAGGTMIGLLFFLAALGQSSPVAIAMFALPAFCGAHLYFGPVYAATADSVGPHARATAVAILLMVMNGLGLGIGPTLVGMLSDHFTTSALGDQAAMCATARSTQDLCSQASAAGLTRALRIDALFYIWASVHFLLGARALKADQPHSSER